MTRSRLITFSWPLAALLGVMFALLAPKPASSLWVSFYVEVWPGGGSSLTCGWHQGPCYDDDSQVSSGTALDWAAYSNVTFIVKFQTSSSLFSVAGTGWVANDAQGTCDHRVHVSIYDAFSNWRAGSAYQHTASSLTDHSININTGYMALATTSEGLGTTANETGCGSTWTNYHVHQSIDGYTLRSLP